jgi:hypothetical protein
MTIRALVEYDPSDLKRASVLVNQALPQCPPDLPLLDGEPPLFDTCELS